MMRSYKAKKRQARLLRTTGPAGQPADYFRHLTKSPHNQKVIRFQLTPARAKKIITGACFVSAFAAGDWTMLATQGSV